VSDAVALTLRAPLEHALDASCIVPDRFAALSAREISALPMRHGGRAAILGDFFAVRGERAARVRVAGNLELADGIGTAMSAGELVIDGNVGRDVGSGCRGVRRGAWRHGRERWWRLSGAARGRHRRRDHPRLGG
jgi:formylmethanofuran dehydrogenase subunit C